MFGLSEELSVGIEARSSSVVVGVMEDDETSVGVEARLSSMVVVVVKAIVD